MLRRHDSLLRTALTLGTVFVCGLVFEADGLRIWADRLPVGVLRGAVLPLATQWQAMLAPLHAGSLRTAALQAKVRLLPEEGGTLVEQGPAGEAVSINSGPKEGPVSVSVSTLNVIDGQSVSSAMTALAPAEASRLALGRVGAPVVVADKVDSPLIALAGDSMMAVGLAPVLGRDLAAVPGFRLVKAYRSGTGLARPEVFDWLQQYPLMLSGEKPALVICAIGANDAQNVQVGKKVLEFGSPEWDEYYRARLASYLSVLGVSQVRVLWIGLPFMKERKFSKKIQHLNQLIQAEVTRLPNVTWMDPNPALGYARGFEQYRPNAHGRLIKLRADDGIHMTDDGAAYLLPSIHEWLGRVARVESVPATKPEAALPDVQGSAPRA